MTTPPTGAWPPSPQPGSNWLTPLPAPPPNRAPWIIAALVIVTVIAIVTTTTVIKHSHRDLPAPTADGADTDTPAIDMASTADVGPLTVVTADPVCDDYKSVVESLEILSNPVDR